VRDVSGLVRVTYFINSLEQGGAERQLAELIKGLDRARFTPSLIVCSPVNQLGDALPVETLTSLDDALFPTPWGIARLASALRAQRPDIVHASKGLENVVGRVVARAVGVRRVVASVRCPKLTWRERAGETLTHRYGDVTVVNSVGIRRELVALGVPESTVEVVENGADLVRFAPLNDEDRKRVRAEYGVSDGPLLVMPGRLSPEKNQRAVVRALAALRSRGGLPKGLRVVFAGRDSLLVYGRAVKALAMAHRLGDVVRFVGNVARIEALVGASDGVLLPSFYEGLPNAVVEAMACGVPALVTPEANADGLITEGVEGIVAASPSVSDVTDAIGRLLSLDGDARQAMGRRGRAHAERRFALATMVRNTEAVYARLLSKETP
jgi:glycosyltransferase involved in cell wall biosynthesis